MPRRAPRSPQPWRLVAATALVSSPVRGGPGTHSATVPPAPGGPPGAFPSPAAPPPAAAIIRADQLDTPASWEGFQAIGSGLGAAAFIVIDDKVDITSVGASASRFLAVESCGQCTPCKQDSLLITDALTRIETSKGSE